MELLSPAGNIEKLYYAYEYGADAVYIGLQQFSLRSKADNFSATQIGQLKSVKAGRKLYGALNIFFHPGDLKTLRGNLAEIAQYPFDALIVSDIGTLPILQEAFPGTELHLSTQANCVNEEAVKLYRDMGFSRIILGRELTLREIELIRNAVPDIELETFVHGAMCLAYSGRCFLSKYMAGRSGNKGDCAHSCRWQYRVLEEGERPGEYFPVEEGENFTTILSSKDLCMIDHIKELSNAGIDSLKIEGRMKSIYYTAVVTRAYRKMIDAVVKGKNIENIDAYREELFHVSHREYSTGFYYGREEISVPAEGTYHRTHLLLGTVTKAVAPNRYLINVKNSIRSGLEIEYIGPDILSAADRAFRIYDENGLPAEAAHHGRDFYLETAFPLKEGYIIRRKL